MAKKTVGVPLEGFAEFTKNAVHEGCVLLKNEDNTLPVLENEAVSLFGRAQISYYRCGTGSGGAVHVPYTTNILSGFRKTVQTRNIMFNENLAKIYEEWVEKNPHDNGGGGWAAEPWCQKEMPVSDEFCKEARAFSEKAVYVIGRTAGEDKDNFDGEGGYRLTKDEENVLKTLTSYFEKVAVILNTGNVIDMNWINDPVYQGRIKAVMYVWQGGIEGGTATAEVILGASEPSGKLPDTIAYHIEDYPAAKNFGQKEFILYQEDIYVGYRYFETFCPEKVMFEFGYGITYTDFEIKLNGSKSLKKENEDYLEISVGVKNTGDVYSGKEVVQVYFGAPQGKLGRPLKELIAFQKTPLLKPHESVTLTFLIQIKDMAGYDDGGYTGYKSVYVLEAGDYNIYIGNSVKNITDSLTIKIDELVLVKQCEQCLAPVQSFTRMRPVLNENGKYAVEYVDVPVEKINLEQRIIENLPAPIPQTGNKGYKLQDVYDKKISLEEFVAQLSDHELAVIVRGEGMGSAKSTPGAASVFGGVSDSLFEYGIPIGCSADGPSGVRLDSGFTATQIPIGTLLSSMWNEELMEEIYTMEGKELNSNDVDTLLGPGMNIHRHPLCGRNFEYYSEDPYLTGVMARSAAKGIFKSGSHATLKHLACNNQELSRHHADSVLSERALREIYIKGFKIVIDSGIARSVMTCYNRVNGRWGASNYDLNTSLLRNEFGFKGIIMTDWWANINNPVTGGAGDKKFMSYMVRAQNDIYMCVNNNGAEINSSEDDTLYALEKGTLTVGELQRSAMNICGFLMQSPCFFRKQDFEGEIRFMKAVPATEKINVQKISENQRVIVKNISAIEAEAGVYTVIAKVMSPMTNLAQCASNLLLNGEFAAVIQTNGTDGNWITQKLLKLELESGFYDIEFFHRRPGMEIEWIEFRK